MPARVVNVEIHGQRYAVRSELAGLAMLYDADEISASSGHRVHRLIVRRPG